MGPILSPGPRASIAAAALLALAACGEPSPATPSPSAPALAGDGHGWRAPGGLEILDPADPADPGYLDFGVLRAGESAERTLRVRNREGRPLKIESVKAGCSCTIPSLSYATPAGQRVVGDVRSSKEVLTLPEGQEAELAVRVESRLAPTKNKPRLILVRLVSDSERNPFQTLQVRIHVEELFSAAPPAVQIRQAPLHAGGSGKTEIVALSPRGERLVDILECPEGLGAELELAHDLGVDRWILRVRAPPPVTLGQREYTIRLRTTGPDGAGEGPPWSVPVVVAGIPDVQVEPAMLVLRSPAPGEPEEARGELVTHLPGHRLKVRGASVAGQGSEALRVEIKPLAPDDRGRSARWSVRLHALEPLGPELQDGTVTIELEDPEFPRVEVRFFRRQGA